MAHEIKANGLPKGQGLYWKDSKKRDHIWIVISHHGKVTRHPAGTAKWKDALKERDRLRADLIKGDKVAAIRKIVLIPELLDDYLKHLERKQANQGVYASNGARKTGYTVNKHVRPYFEKQRADRLGTDELNAYWDFRIAEYRAVGAAEGSWVVSINRELTYLRAAMYRGFHATPRKVAFVPKFPIDHKAEKARARTGTVTRTQYESLMQHLADHMKPVLPFVMYAGVREKELKFIRQEQVDWGNMVIHLRKGETKDGDARDVPIVDLAVEPLKRWMKLTDEFYPNCIWLFHYNGSQIIAWRTAWNNACRRAELQRPRLNPDGTPKLSKKGKPLFENLVKFHDTRRTAITTQGQAKVTEADSMRTSGHHDLEVHRKYDQDLGAAKRVREQLNTYLNGGEAESKSPVSTLDVPGLEKLMAWYEKGLLTAQEFEAAKKKLISSAT